MNRPKVLSAFFPIVSALTFLASLTPASFAQTQEPSVEKLKAVVVNEVKSVADKYKLPQVTQTVTAAKMEETINVMDTEDSVKYLPSVFLRKRNQGDTQAVMGTRVWGVSSSARSLIYADGVLLSALIANNNNIGGPRWGLVAPSEIERVDMMYGPFAAAYSGNSMGAVMEITTRLPEKFEGTLNETMALQTFKLYGTENTYRTLQTAANVGDRIGKFSFWASANYQDSHSQPLSYVTGTTFPTGTTGGYAAANKLGVTANILGASGLLHTRMTNAKFKAAYDLTPTLRAAYTFGFWQNDADSSVQSFLTNAAGQPTFAGQAGFASGYYKLLQQHSSHSLTLRTNTHTDWDFEAAATLYRMDKDRQQLPTTVSATAATTPSFGTAGRVAVLGGTSWATLDVKGTWRPGGKTAAHILSFGVHDDHNNLYNPTFNTPDWAANATYTSVATEGDGKSRTQAIWAQDLWQVGPDVKVTFGARYEDWRAYDGYNVNGAVTIRQPEVSATKFSPKATISWTPSHEWNFTASFGKAYRFATPSELYQLVSTGTTFTSPNPNLKPDNVFATELRFERTFEHGNARLSLFQDDIHDAIIGQFAPLVPGSPTLYSYSSNVDHVRARGVEFVLVQSDVLIRGLELTGSVTYLDAKTLATKGQGQFGSAIGKRLPNIPEWRSSFVVTYRPDQRWAFTLGGRYSSQLYTTLDDADVNFNTYQGFSLWFVADAHVNCRINANWAASVGVDNLLNRKYFVFHPFPQRSYSVNLKYAF